MADTEVLDAVAAMPPMVSSEYHVVATGIATRLGAAEMAVLERCIADASDPTRGFNALYVLLARHRRALDASRFRALYQRHAAEQLEKTVADVEERARAEIGKVRSETLGTLGLLAAVIAFIVTTTQIADRQPVNEALRLLTGCAGMLSLVFTAFGAVFGVVRPARLILPAVLGGGLLLAAFLT
ncbi:hypothetical protein [Streptomyces nigrescens]|uniref:hypothetical protein n=1 Tax=Streptomyces nigrescens TaxID=1920 RepID=UPI00346CBB48